ncbi:hypothetical protein [Thiolapillus sp.]|uniref:hypothetical protein n=1 Tax=Thiolapillus sp. TaxID=2017437 RepID=UPI003AF96E1C
MKHIDTQTGPTDAARMSIVPYLTLSTMRNINDKNITIWHYIENVTVAMQTLINTPQCTDDGDVEDEILALVTAYDRLLQKISVKQIRKEEMKNESL